MTMMGGLIDYIHSFGYLPRTSWNEKRDPEHGVVAEFALLSFGRRRKALDVIFY